MIIIDMRKPEIWVQKPGFVGMCEHIARCAAICYDSKPKTGGAAVDFVKSLDKKGHGRPLEFGYLWCIDYGDISDAFWNRKNPDDQMILTNVRELRKSGFDWSFIEGEAEESRGEITPVTIHYPALSRGIADELRTHITLSSLMRSTRYVDETKTGDVFFIRPYWYDWSQDHFEYACHDAERHYQWLRIEHKRQDAREVLPLCVKTELVQCGFPEAWENLIKQRDSKEAHPDARQLAQWIRELIFDKE